MKTYIARNTLTGQFYIGSTVNFQSRKKQHLSSDSTYPFHRDLRRNPDSFEWEVFEDDSEGRELEEALLEMFFGTEMCYNLSPGSSLNPWSSKGYRWVTNGLEEKYVEVDKDPPAGWEIGRLPVSDMTRAKMRESQTGKKRPECASAVGKTWVTNKTRTEELYLDPGEEIPEGWVKGRKKFPPRTQESKDKTSKTLRGRKKTKEHKEKLRVAALRQHHG